MENPSPQFEQLSFLSNNFFLRNFSIESFCEYHEYEIPINEYVCYNVGLINGKKYVQSFQILARFLTGINSFHIRWWNTSFVKSEEDLEKIDHCDFWVHSGISLRKNFFLFEDRFSLFRSSFLYDTNQKIFFRLFALEKFFKCPETTPQLKIYSSPCKFFLFKQRPCRGRPKRNHPKKELKKYLNLILKECNYQNTLQKENPTLFLEITKTLSRYGEAP